MKVVKENIDYKLTEKEEKVLSLQMDEKGKDKIKKILSDIKPLRGKEININNLEKLVNSLTTKYRVVSIQYIMNHTVYGKEGRNLVLSMKTNDNKWIASIYESTFENLFMKYALLTYMITKRNLEDK